MKNKMKTLTVLLLLFAMRIQAQAVEDPKFAHLDIHSNTVCETCKKTIESEMIYVKGVHAVTVDPEAQVIHVEYKAKKTDPDKLRLALTKIGYDADDLKADPKARSGLPMCCRPEAGGGH